MSGDFPVGHPQEKIMNTRIKLTKALSEKVLKEYSHRCAKCGNVDPQLHHIDENNSNNTEYNIIPLCPNCHLTDQHNPTKKIPIQILRFFRKFKDPTILAPQFQPLFERFTFATEKVGAAGNPDHWIKDFLLFVKNLSMGDYYLEAYRQIMTVDLNDTEFKVTHAHSDESTMQKELIKAKIEFFKEGIIHERLERLLIELIRFQDWKN